VLTHDNDHQEDMPTLTRDRPKTTRAAPARDAGGPVSPLQAVVRHPLLAIVPVLLLVAAALYISERRPATFTAQSRVAIGSFNPSPDQAPGAAFAGTQFASAYSRAITANQVINPVARRTGLRPAQVAARLSASPVPDSPIVRIDATGPSAASAVKLSGAATDALIAYVHRSDSNTQASTLLDRFRAAQARAAAAHSAVRRATVNRDLSPSSNSAQARLDRAQTEADTADLRASALRQAYLQRSQSQTSGIPVRTLNTADAATSDRNKTMKLLVTIAVLAGIAVGVALATARAASRSRRRAATA
jgi:capsular polysaccharide biosynthesis protein